MPKAGTIDLDPLPPEPYARAFRHESRASTSLRFVGPEVASPFVGVLVSLLAGPPDAPAIWRGTVAVDGMIHEPGGFHPYQTTLNLVLRETARVAVPSGTRVWLVSENSRSDVVTSVHQEGGALLCSGTGTERLNGRIGYLETKAGTTTYHLAIPRAFVAFSCGRNQVIKRDRVVVIGAGDAEAADIETADTLVRSTGPGGASMRGSFRSTKSRTPVGYEYEVTWSLARQPK
jgi:hypothetical protein